MELKKQLTICVIGGGISGMSSAYCLARRFPGCNIKVYSNEFTPGTTSNHGFGLVSFIKGDDFVGERTREWSQVTADYCKAIYEHSPEIACEMGIMATNGLCFYEEKQTTAKDIDSIINPQHFEPKTFSSFHELGRAECEGLQNRYGNLECVFGHPITSLKELHLYSISTFVIDSHSYLPWLRKELELMAARKDISSVRFIHKRLSSIFDVVHTRCDLVVNCSGMGAEYLVPDINMVPIRGQYLLVKPRKKIDMHFGNRTFICPKPGRVAIGSVYQVGHRDLEVDARDTADLIQRSQALCPDLKSMEILEVGVAIRPGRKGGPRVEMELRKWERMTIPVIHNYGHGAKGIMQHWGCAREVEKIACDYLNRISKL